MGGEDEFDTTVPDAVKKSSKHLVYVICKSLTGNSQAAVWKNPTQECKFKRGDHWGGQEPKKLNFAFAVQSSFNAYYMGQCVKILLSSMNGNKKQKVGRLVGLGVGK